MSELEDIKKRLSDLESKVGSSSKVENSPRAPRKPSAYNDFMKDYFLKNKDSNKSKSKSHKELFGEAAKAWIDFKEKKK